MRVLSWLYLNLWLGYKGWWARKTARPGQIIIPPGTRLTCSNGKDYGLYVVTGKINDTTFQLRALQDGVVSFSKAGTVIFTL